MLVLDAGDGLIKDRPPATTSQAESSIYLLNTMRYDAAALGEGDLAQLGLDLIRKLCNGQECQTFTYLAPKLIERQSVRRLDE